MDKHFTTKKDEYLLEMLKADFSRSVSEIKKLRAALEHPTMKVHDCNCPTWSSSKAPCWCHAQIAEEALK